MSRRPSMHFTTPGEAMLHREQDAMASPEIIAAQARIEDAIYSGRRPIRLSVSLVGDKTAQSFLRRRYEAAGWAWVYVCDPGNGDYIEIRESSP